MKVKNTICQNFGDKIEAKHLKVTFEIEAAGWLLVIVVLLVVGCCVLFVAGCGLVHSQGRVIIQP